MIVIEKLSKFYGPHKVIDAINLNFQEGNVYGIIGENGAGKTTLFRCLAALEDYEGEIKYPKGVLKNTIGFLPTDPFFFSKITGQEYLQLLCNARKIPQQIFQDKNIFDLPLNQYADTYSTGMKKKLALMGILLQKNEVFILDEPFNGVDIQSNILIKELILKLKSLNKIVLISSHIFSTLQETCDYLHLLKEGKIIKTVPKEKFIEIEKEMKNIFIGDKIEKFNLQ